MKLTKEQFKNFIDVCSVIETVSNDIHVHNGKIKQFARRKDFIVHVDMTDAVFKDVGPIIEDLKISNAKERLKVFKAFLDETTTHYMFTHQNNYYVLSDNESSFYIAEPTVDALASKYDETATPGNLTDDKLIFEYTLTSNILKKIKAIADVCGSSGLDIKMYPDKGKVELCLDGSSKVLKSSLVSFDYNTTLLDDGPMLGRVSFDCMLFSDSVNIKMYSLGDSFVAFSTEMEIGECPVIFYQRIRIGSLGE